MGDVTQVQLPHVEEFLHGLAVRAVRAHEGLEGIRRLAAQVWVRIDRLGQLAVHQHGPVHDLQLALQCTEFITLKILQARTKDLKASAALLRRSGSALTAWDSWLCTSMALSMTFSLPCNAQMHHVANPASRAIAGREEAGQSMHAAFTEPRQALLDAGPAAIQLWFISSAELPPAHLAGYQIPRCCHSVT